MKVKGEIRWVERGGRKRWRSEKKESRACKVVVVVIVYGGGRTQVNGAR